MLKIKTVLMSPDTLSIRTLFYFIILFPFIQQRTLEELPRVATLYKAATILSAACVIFYILLKEKIKVRKDIWIYIVFWGIYFISSCMYSQRSIPRVLYNAIVMFSLVLFLYTYIRQDLLKILKVLSYIYGAFIYLNFILDFIFPHGLYKTSGYHAAHLLGDDNAVIYVALPGLIIMVCYSIMKHSRITWQVWMAAVITEISLLRVWSVSAMAMLTMFLIMLIYVIKIGNINYRLLLGSVLFAMAVCLFGLSNSHVQAFIVNVLHKDATLSGRTILWSGALEMIAKQPLLGYGGYYEYGRFRTSALYTYSCHTPYLQLMIDGGILLFAIFVLIVFKAFHQMKKNNKNIYIGVMTIGLTCMMINYITEQVRFYHFFIIVSFMMNINAFPDVSVKKLDKQHQGFDFLFRRSYK